MIYRHCIILLRILYKTSFSPCSLAYSYHGIFYFILDAQCACIVYREIFKKVNRQMFENNSIGKKKIVN